MNRRAPKLLRGRADRLQGWNAIAEHLGQPVAVAQRWAKDGMPVRREGRYTVASAEELSRWLGKEAHAGGAVHITQEGEQDLAAELRRGLREIRVRKKTKR